MADHKVGDLVVGRGGPGVMLICMQTTVGLSRMQIINLILTGTSRGVPQRTQKHPPCFFQFFLSGGSASRIEEKYL